MRKIILASPREPSGATWLINCFLELGIKTYRNSADFVWQQNSNGQYFLTEREQLLRKWLPALTDQDLFDFRDDIEVQWLHEWPQKKHADYQVIYFVRDPRDSLFSRYKRENPELSLREFIDFPDTGSLFDKVDNWALFNRFWLSHPSLKTFRFEDYKKSATQTLIEILEYLNLSYSEASIQLAIENSTYERAVECERKYREENLEDQETINRGGKVGEWKGLNDNDWLTEQIERRCSDVLDKLGYDHSRAVTDNIPSGLPNIQTLSFFDSTLFPKVNKPENRQNDEENMQRLALLAESICFGDGEKKVQALIKDYEYIALLKGLIELVQKNSQAMSPYVKNSPRKITQVLKKKIPVPSIITRVINRVKRCMKL